MIHTEFVPLEQTVNHVFIKTSLKGSQKGNLRETRHCKQMYAPSWQHPMSQCSLRHRTFYLKRHSCGSPAPIHLTSAPVTVSFLLNLKMPSQDIILGLKENIQKSITDMLKSIPVEDFQRCYQQWEQCLWCVAAQGNYFEGDNIDVWKK
jgi:hypothetical protein